MALNKETWIAEIQKNLYPANSFYNFAKNDNAFITNKTVHLPQSGAMPTALINPTVPLTAPVKRTDVDLTYDLVNIVSPQMYIDYIEDIEFSYDIRASYIEDMVMSLNTAVGNFVAVEWSNTPGTNIVRTSGASRNAYHSVQTGTRKKLVLADLQEASRLMDNDNIPMEGRKLLVDGNLYTDLLDIAEFKDSYLLIGNVATDGFVGRVAGFDVIKRSQTVAYSEAAGAKRILGIPTAVTDQLGAIAWHPSFVRKANGGVNMFGMDRMDPAYMQYVISARIRYGATKARTSEAGVVTIVESTGV